MAPVKNQNEKTPTRKKKLSGRLSVRLFTPMAKQSKKSDTESEANSSSRELSPKKRPPRMNISSKKPAGRNSRSTPSSTQSKDVAKKGGRNLARNSSPALPTRELPVRGRQVVLAKKSAPPPPSPSPEREPAAKSKPARKPRRTNRAIRGVFASKAVVKERPSAALTSYMTFLVDKHGKRFRELKQDQQICHMARIQELEALEEKLRKKVGDIMNLKVTEEDHVSKKQEVLDIAENDLLELQLYTERLQYKLNIERPTLRAQVYQRFVCCRVCLAKASKNRQ